MTGLLAFLIGMVALGPSPVQRERLAVWIDATGAAVDALELADNLADVAISRLAGAPDRELVGTREIRDKLQAIAGQGAESCFERRECLAALAEAVSVQRVMTGRVQRSNGQFTIDLTFFDLRRSTAPITLHRESPETLPDLIRMTQDAVVALVAASEEKAPKSDEGPARPIAPPPSLLLTPPIARADTKAAMATAPAPAPPDHPASRAESYLLYASAAAAVISFAAAAIAGTIAGGDLQGADRRAKQLDLIRREAYAEAADGLVAAGFIASGLTAWLWLRR